MSEHKRRQPASARKGPRRRTHKGRVAGALIILILIIAAVLWLVSRCSGGTLYGDGSGFRSPVTEAVKAGRQDAKKVFDTAPGSMERDNALLYIRSREAALRRAGYAHAADDYINAAREELSDLKN